jgi:hypothetical protein
VLLTVPSPATAADPADVAATHAFLEARYQLAVAENANSPLAAKAAENVAAGLGGECAGVLTGAPSGLLSEAFREGPVSPRRIGELRRQEQQLTAVDAETDAVLYTAFEAPYAAARQSFATAVAALTWTDPRIAEKVRAEATARAFGPPESSAETCADMRAWAASGFRSVSPHTKGLIEQNRTLVEELSISDVDVETLLRPYESKADRELVRRTEQTGVGRLRAFIAVFKSLRELRARLGLKEPKSSAFKPPKKLGRGRTQGGDTFIVTAEQGHVHRAGCRLEVNVEYEHSTNGGLVTISTGGGGGPVCVAGRTAQRSSDLEACNGGLLTITAATPGAASVRLLLANGRTITSRTVFIPKRNRGPAWVYAQALGRKSARPLSLTELDSNGATVAVVRLHPHGRCPAEREGLPVSFPVARGTAPDGRPFAIEAFQFPGGRAHEEAQLTLSLETPEEAKDEAIPIGSFHREFQPQIAHECPPHEFSLVYGHLRDPATAVSVRTAAGVQALATVTIPPAAHETGLVAYGVFTSPPLELIVSGPGGRTLFTESLAKRDAEQREFCEGYAEP